MYARVEVVYMRSDLLFFFFCLFFFFNDTATTEIYTLSLHDALPISMIITADHGNAESMLDPEGVPLTAHTTNRVPLILVGPGFRAGAPKLRTGRLADIAPTILKIMGLPKPEEMTGKALF